MISYTIAKKRNEFNRKLEKMDDFGHLSQELQALEAQGMYRKCVCVESAQGPVVEIDGRQVVLFCSNNYLNLAGHPKIRQAAIEAIEKFGWGAAAARLMSGTMTPHVEAERAWAKFFGKPAALFFGSGWSANQSVLTTLPQKGDLVLLDRMDHASIIDAARTSEAQFHTYRRDNLDRLEKYLADPQYRCKYIVTESVFSMDGDTADLKALAELKNKYNAVLIVDEAHAVGCMGSRGAGLAEEAGVLDAVDIVVAPLGKGPACGGAIVAADKVVIEYLINKARPFIFTTAPAPAAAAAALAALEIIQNEPQRRLCLKQNANALRRILSQSGLNIGNSTTHILPVIVGSAEKTVKIAQKLLADGFFCTAIRPPTVPAGTERLRISVQCTHTQEQLAGLCDALGRNFFA
jgi:8-amino-7-oxononanoate synthase